MAHSVIFFGLLATAFCLRGDEAPSAAPAPAPVPENGVLSVLETVILDGEHRFDAICPAWSPGETRWDAGAAFLTHFASDDVSLLSKGVDGQPVLERLRLTDVDAAEGDIAVPFSERSSSRWTESWLEYSPRPAVSGDLNGDGIADLVYAGARTDLRGPEVRLVLSGRNGYRLGSVLPTVGRVAALALYDVLPAPGLELIVTRWGGVPEGSILLYGWSEDRWMLRSEVGLGSAPAKPRTTGVLDFDGDGRLDLVCFDARSRFGAVYLQREDGSFELEDSTGLEAGSFIVASESIDLDREGLSDLVVQSLAAPSSLAYVRGRAPFRIVDLEHPKGWSTSMGLGVTGRLFASPLGGGGFEVVRPIEGGLAVVVSDEEGIRRAFGEYSLAERNPAEVTGVHFGGSDAIDLVIVSRTSPGVTILVR